MLYVVQDALLWTVSSLVPCTECPQQLECFTCKLGMHLLVCFTQMKSSLSALSPPCNKNQSRENGDCQDICFSVLQIQAKTLKWTYPFYLFYQSGTKSSLLCSIPTLELEEIWGIPSLLSTSCENDSSGNFSSKFYASLPTLHWDLWGLQDLHPNSSSPGGREAATWSWADCIWKVLYRQVPFFKHLHLVSLRKKLIGSRNNHTVLKSVLFDNIRVTEQRKLEELPQQQNVEMDDECQNAQRGQWCEGFLL